MGEDVEEKYANELLALKINSKPLINSLTMMAEDFIQFAPVIVKVIEKHLAKVAPEAKLPVLYLIDSIVKNIKKEYVELFSQNIVATFCGVFESVDDRNVRGNLYKLRQTWVDVFHTKKLMTIDLRCSDLDEKWPIGGGFGGSNTASTIHVNPKFLPSGGLRNSGLLSLSYDSSLNSAEPSTDLEMKKQLIAKHRQLIELQEKKLELELLEKQFSMEEQSRKKKQQEDQANAKLLAQAELAKQKTQAAASMMARVNSISSPIQPVQKVETEPVMPAAPVRPPIPTPQPYQVPRNPPESVDRISRNPDLFPSDPRVRRNVILQQQQQSNVPVRRMTPWNPHADFNQNHQVPLRHPHHDFQQQPAARTPPRPIISSPSPRRSPPPAPRLPRAGDQLETNVRKPILSEDGSAAGATFMRTAKDESPRRESASPSKRSRSRSPKRETVPPSKSRGSSKESQGSGGGRRSGGEETASPQRPFHSELSHFTSPRRSQSPKHLERERNDRKRSRASSKSSSGSRKSTESEKDVSLSREKDTKSTPEKVKRPRPRGDNRQNKIDRYLNRSSSVSSQSSSSPTKKRPESDNGESSKSKDTKTPDVDLRVETLFIPYGNNGLKREEIHIESKSPPKQIKEKEVKKGNRRAKPERKPHVEQEVKARNEMRKAERQRQRETEREQFKNRTSAVLSRNYRKRSGIPETEEDESTKKFETTDIDQRFENKNDKDVDLRKSSTSSAHGLDSEKAEPPSAKKSRNSSLIDNLFGREDVDLRPSSSCWSQVKKPNEDGRRDSLGESGGEATTDEQLKDMLRDGKQRPPPALSPASSVGSTAPSGCDALGRPLAFARLPDDPEERRRSLGSRSASVDPLETFRSRYIETPLRVKGFLDPGDLEMALSRGKEEVDQGTLTTVQFNIISKELVQLNEGIKIRKVQEMDSISRPGPGGHLPNPWNPDANPVWSVAVPSFPRPSIPMGMVRPEEPAWPRGPRHPVGPRGPNPFIEAINPNPVPEILIPFANPQELALLELDIDGTTPLDKVPRQVRFYGNTAVVFIGNLSDEPKEIFFLPEDGLRTLYINNEPLKIRWGVSRKFYYAKKSHEIRIGAPTRELYIDGIGYEVYFGGMETRIAVDNHLVRFRLAGPPPGVKIGMGLRYDLVAGRTTVFIDGAPYSLYLDEKPQLLDFGGFPVIAKFCDDFRTITLNGFAFPTLFGAAPRPVMLPNRRRFYIRFNAISPITEQNIMTHIRARAQAQNVAQGPSGGRPRDVAPFGSGFNPNALPGFSQHPIQELSNSSNPLDMVANLLPSTNAKETGIMDNSYEVEPSSKSKDVVKSNAAEEAPLNVQDLLSKLLLAGLLPTGNKPKEEPTPKEEKAKEEAVKVEPKVSNQDKVVVPEVKPEVIPPPIPQVEVVNVSFTDNLKKRRPKIIEALYIGVQCGSCGLRFPGDQNYKYTQHLDWHFRQNRREKANARKALSRKWYYDLSDWIQFEEVEDLEDRATSLFEPQEVDMEDDKSGAARLLDPDSYTVLATGFEGVTCPQCGEGFETFYDEEKEEWRLRDAMQDPTPPDNPEGNIDDKKLFHPICHQDYLNSLVEEEEPKAEDAKKSPEPVPAEDDDEVMILREGPKEVVLAEVDIAEDEEAKGKDEECLDAGAEPESVLEVTGAGSEEESGTGVTAPKPSGASYLVLSPVVIDVNEDDNSNIPGIARGVEGSGVFGFALNSLSSHATPTPASSEESRPIVYEAMKFDFPKIKEEPVEWKDIAQDQIISSTLFPHLSPGAEPMDITLDDDDSGIEARASSSLDTPSNSQSTVQVVIHDIDLTDDDGDVSAASRMPVVAEIDGNVQYRATEVVKTAPAKIKINIFGLDTASQSPTHKSSASVEAAPEALKSPVPSPRTPEKAQSTPDLESLFKSDELRKLKPKLAAAVAGKKLVNNPVKRTGREESGLCSIM